MSRKYRDFGVAGRADCGTRKVGMVQSLEAQTRRCSAGSEDATTCAGDSGASYWSPSIESSMVRQSRATHTLPPQHEVTRGSRRCAQRAPVQELARFRKRPLPSCSISNEGKVSWGAPGELFVVVSNWDDPSML